MVCLRHKIKKINSRWKIKGFGAQCLKARSNNIFLCPKKTRKSKKNKIIDFFHGKLSGHACCRSKKMKKKRRNSNKVTPREASASKKSKMKRRNRRRNRRSRSRSRRRSRSRGNRRNPKNSDRKRQEIYKYGG